MFNFGAGAVYAKWLDDIDDASCSQHIVPNMAPGNFHTQARGRCFSGSDPGWESGFVDVLSWHYRYYGDAQVLARHWSAAEGSVAFLSRYVSNATGGLLTVTGYPATVLGDWCAPSGNVTAPDSGHHVSNIISGFFWIRQLEAMAGAARVLGNTTAAADYLRRASTARASFGRRYFDSERGLFRDPDWVAAWGSPVMQTEQALAITLCLDLQDGYGPGTWSMEDGRAAPSIRRPTTDGRPTQIVPPADVARAAAALAANVSAGLFVGMVGVKHVFSALAATGHGAVALAALTRTTYPSYGWMLDPARGEGTIWERWEGDVHDLKGSRNHIMLGSPGQFLYQSVAGIDVGRGGVAFDRVSIAPMAAAAAATSGLHGVDATVGTPRGAISVSWRTVDSASTMCATAAERNNIGEPLHLDCRQAGTNATIGHIAFASFGTPTGSCADPASLAVNSVCNAPTSYSVVTSLCVGKQRCTLYANDTQFGGDDPCHGVKKHLTVAASCTHACHIRFVLNATLPVGSNGTVVLPTPSAATIGCSRLIEGGVTVYRDGEFLPGVAIGVVSVRAVGSALEVAIGGGSYSFALLWCK
jgi:hypothetical protein